MNRNLAQKKEGTSGEQKKYKSNTTAVVRQLLNPGGGKQRLSKSEKKSNKRDTKNAAAELYKTEQASKKQRRT